MSETPNVSVVLGVNADDVAMLDKIRDEIADNFELTMEYNLTIAMAAANGDQECVQYFVRRRDVLLREMVKAGKEQGLPPAEVFYNYQKAVHKRLHPEEAK